MNLEKRNVIDYYRYWTTEAVRADLDSKRFNYGVLCANIQGDFNIGSVIRSANAFLAREVIIYGKKRYDPRGTVGTHHYENFRHVRLTDSLVEAVKGYDRIVGIDNIDRALPIDEMRVDRDEKVLLCFGEEDSGLPKEVMDICNEFAYIRQFGSVRSLNVGCAAAISLFEYTRRCNVKQDGFCL